MNLRMMICTAALSLAFSVPAFADSHSIQVVSFSEEADSVPFIQLTGSKVIMDDFSFKIPGDLKSHLVIVPGDGCYELYDKTAYELDGSGLLFRITCLEDASSEDLKYSTVLAFCGDQTYVLEPGYPLIYEPESEEYQACEEAFSAIRESFVSYIR